MALKIDGEFRPYPLKLFRLVGQLCCFAKKPTRTYISIFGGDSSVVFPLAVNIFGHGVDNLTT